MTARVVKDEVTLDALLVRPVVSSLRLGGDGGATELVHSSARSPQRVSVGFDGRASTTRVYGPDGALRAEVRLDGTGIVSVPTGGFAVVATDETE